jgi:hypothetical protein
MAEGNDQLHRELEEENDARWGSPEEEVEAVEDEDSDMDIDDDDEDD